MSAFHLQTLIILIASFSLPLTFFKHHTYCFDVVGSMVMSNSIFILFQEQPQLYDRGTQEPRKVNQYMYLKSNDPSYEITISSI